MKDIEITTPFIKLGQFLKYANIAASGGDVKAVLFDESVKVNDEVETRRGRKLYPGDRIDVEGVGTFTIHHGSD
ncbi:MAG: RNA-binding S4 domain-containing protein [Bacillota bacterium]